MPRRTPADRLDKILTSAQQVFAARGYAAARLEDVAAGAGISKASLYLHFPDKAALFQGLIDRLLAANLPTLLPPLPDDVPVAPMLRRFIETGMQLLTQGDISFLPRLVIGEGGNFPEIARAYHDRAISTVLGLLESLIRHGEARGEFRRCDAASVAKSIAGGVVLSAIWKTVFEPVGAIPLDPVAMAQSHADLVLRGLAADAREV